MSQSPVQLIEWLKTNMERNNWGIRETARRAGVSHPTISDLLNGKSPSLETSIALAKLFNTTTKFILTLAGIAESDDQLSPKKHELMEKLKTANDADTQVVIEMLEVAVRNRQRQIPNNINPKTTPR